MSDADRPRVTLLAIDDDPKSLELIQDALSRDDLTILTSTDPAAGLELALQHHPEIVLLDLVMPGIDGIAVLERILAAVPTTEVILITGHYTAESAVEAIRKGASDYLTKPLSVARLRERIEALIAEHRLRQRALQLDGELLKTCQFEGMVGRSPLMLEVFARIRRAAPHFKTALVTGATGTGKELVARALHKLGPAASARFAVCSSSAIVETLFESELFGHVKGAFTDAIQNRKGRFELADTGTIFLDEIGDIPLKLQAKLLRVLQQHSFEPVGSSESITVNVRIIAATNKDIEDLVEKGEFRSDLYYRLNVLPLHVPPLRQRKEDIPALADFFLKKFSRETNKHFAGFTETAMDLMLSYSWPGNVRELENAVERAVVIAKESRISARDLLLGSGSADTDEYKGKSLKEALSIFKRHFIMKALEENRWNQTESAKVLDIQRTYLSRLIKELDITNSKE